MKKQRILSLCMASLLALSLVACNSPTDEQNSALPTVSVQPTPTPPPIPYTDVAEDSPYYDAVVWAYQNGIASDGETFGPADACTRGQVITFLWRAKGSPEPETAESPFSDVSASDWFYQPALWAYENGVATGTAFNPGNPCTNGEALTFLWRAEGKPAAAVYSSSVALAASGAYYARPAAWAETNGLFAGTDFDPAAPCSRAGLMTYLYWAAEERTFTEEDKTVQAEYEQIINEAQLYEVHGSGLCYADYVDVDGDGKVELLTVGLSDDIYHNKAIVTVYANTNGHVEKYCEGSVDFTHIFSICKSDDSEIFFKNDTYGNVAETHEFYKIENGTFELDERIEVYYGGDAVPENVDKAFETYEAFLQKFTVEQKLISRIDNYYNISILVRGLLPSPEEYPAALAQHRKARLEYLAHYWATIDQTYTKTVQAEFEQIINESQLYEVHGSGLTYADYVEVEENGRAGLLTVAVGGDSVIMTVYVNTGGHAEKYCEQEFPFGSTCCLYFCTYDNHICLRLEKPLSSPDNVFYKIENKTLVLSDSIAEDIGAEGIYYNMSAEGEPITISEAEYNAIMGKYANQRALLGFSYNGVTICSRGLLPSPEEYESALTKQWETEREKIYAAVKNGDFSFFAGTYEYISSGFGTTYPLVLMNNGAVSGGNSLFETGKKPISVVVAEDGSIRCFISGDVEYYEIYPAGISREFGGSGSLDSVRIYYVWGHAGVEEWEFAKVS